MIRPHPPHRTTVRPILLLAGLVSCMALIGGHAIADETPTSGAQQTTETPAEVQARLEAYLRREGYEPAYLAEEERDQAITWLRFSADRAWRSLRNVAYTRLTFSIDTRAPSAVDELRVLVADVAVAFHPATFCPVRMSRILRYTFPRSLGYPQVFEYKNPDGTRSKATEVGLHTFLTYDGRRLLWGQYPTMFVRTASRTLEDGSTRPEYFLVRDDYLEYLPGKGGFAAVLSAGDVAIVDPIVDENDLARRPGLDPRSEEGRWEVNPWVSVFGHRRDMVGPVHTLDEWSKGPLQNTPWPQWWRSPTRIAVFTMIPGSEVPGVDLFVFDRTTGLPIEFSRAIRNPDGWHGLIVLLATYADVLTAEGERIPLPDTVVQSTTGLSDFMLAALDLPVTTTIGAGREEQEGSFHFVYHEVNSTRLDDPDAYSFHRLAEQLGIRLSPKVPVASNDDFVFPVPDLIFGPPKNDPDYLAKWDAAVRDAIAAAALPLPPGALLTYQEIMAREATHSRSMVLRAQYFDDEGNPVPMSPFIHVPVADP